MLEEIGLAYEPHLIDIMANETWGPEFLSLNPNGKIPAIIDPDGPGGQALALFESGAILIYLAEKSGKLLSADPATRYETIQWLMFQMGAVGPMFGQLGFFHRFAGRDYEDKRPRDRYVAESRRLLGVLETRLANEGGEPRLQHAQKATGFGDVAITRALVLVIASGEARRFTSSMEARPPEAITGMEVAAASSRVESQLMPARTPSRSMSV